ncbi:hypothetical protein NIES2135_61590 (plasmid) [Leptolyngbya boryana NIES-2135]|jgi:hypothetical protein|uniref:Uncharacterized protein n=1 Tax=Leptolyngbya boryana NIES-2135 TaxID=1973484 RepID=A0A1Z4JRC1_LEPBY|nr:MULTISPECIES: hypothetical protein [Leptolyngbya]BAY59282.1 hypothetical protein NIES2135_61590 [Leptolyngbya boryana NIES-2135]MBD2372870.1 hypothetical protein [Leptolyngbya sp. FACHB-238]MBD2397377.1 hypothetical protein [Leptolyngbya sp. FACHB-239]MBD2403818.1 hypothetical protein [Leptolyngbya sp. FACHB-402]ULP33474.1 hypothetical protein MCP04_30560 [Leptolyngbya boryana IU 594]
MTLEMPLTHPAVSVSNNLIEAFFSEFGAEFESFVNLTALLDFRCVLACYSAMHLGGEPDYTYVDALRDAPPPDMDISVPVIDAAVKFLFDHHAPPAIAEYLIGRITQLIILRH